MFSGATISAKSFCGMEFAARIIYKWPYCWQLFLPDVNLKQKSHKKFTFFTNDTVFDK
jgi:hypothetical protein